MPLTKISLKPGVVRDVTSYANEGGWYYSDKIRFRAGYPQKIGGWTRFTPVSYLGTCTAIFPWASLGGVLYRGVGTNLKYYIEYGSTLSDITPIRETTAAGAVTFTATDGSTTLAVHDTAHGAVINDFVTFSDAATLGGNITAGVLNQEYQITSVTDADNYEVIATATANASDVGDGGVITVGAYQINTGLALYVPGVGWSAGGFGSGSFGGSTTLGTSTQLRVWTQGTFGEDLVFADWEGQIYYWDTSVGVGARGVRIVDMVGASNVPTIVAGVFVTDSRHVVAYGANPIGAAEQDPLMVRWSDTESAVDWTPTATNTAGGQRLTLGSIILYAANVRLETLIWTDVALYGMTFVGGALEFGFNLLGTPMSLMGPKAVAVVSGIAYWMGLDKFYMYDGSLRTLPCPLLTLIARNLNKDQAWQIFAAPNELFTEVTWFYCSTGTNTIDSYITYNYGENIWYFGTMGRSAWADSSIYPLPVAADNVNNVLLYHETGVDDVSTGTPVAITAYIESSDFDLEDGHRFMFINKAVPDVSFRGSTAQNPAATLILKTRSNPGNDWNASSNQPSSDAVTSTSIGSVSTSPIEQFTPAAWVRLRGRQASIRLESTALGVQWQLGDLRLDIRPDGRR
jgi:hypothetical protein